MQSEVSLVSFCLKTSTPCTMSTQYNNNNNNNDNDNNYEEYYDENENENENNGIIECSSSFMDTSMYYFPSTSTMQKASNLDFGVICQPLIETEETTQEEEEEIPLINFNISTEKDNSSVIRCRSCRAYINPYVEWITNGMHTHWVCNLCGVSNELHSKLYYQNYLNGKCKELQYASVEIIAPDEYCVRPPQFPSYIFVINVNKQLIKSNILNNICNTIKQIINDENNNNFNQTQQTQIGFITYSDKIHYYSLKSNLSKPKMIVINDINDALLPIPADQIMTNLSESFELIDHLLTILPSLHDDNNNISSENALGTALECAFAAIKEIGGKIICFSFGLPSLGKGKVMNRTTTLQNDINEYDKLLKRSNNFFMDLAINLTKYQISCDLFQFSSSINEYCDISTIKGISRCSGGQLFYYKNYNDLINGDSFNNDLYKLLTRKQGWESVMRIRCSKGISIKHYYGCFYRRSADLLSIPTIDCDKSITILLTHSSPPISIDGDNDDKKERYISDPFIYIQSALLYTNSYGQRRIRCCTKQISVTSSYDQLFNNINLSVMTSLIAKQAVFKMLSKDIASSRMFIQDCCVSILSSYCKYCTNNNNNNNSLKTEDEYPMSLRYLPLNTLGLLKCGAFGDIRDILKTWINIDERVYLLINILHLNHNNIELLIRPSLYKIDDLLNLDDIQLNDEYYLPKESPLTLKSLSSKAIYLLDNGQSFIIRIGKNVDLNKIKMFFQKNNGFYILLNDINHNKYIYKLYNILQYLQSINYRYQSINVILETQNDENNKFNTMYLIQDRTESVMSYQEFFTFLFKQTRLKRPSLTH